MPNSAAPASRPYVPSHKIRLVTAAALFDGHDASINIMRRILQTAGAEVVHLGHNRAAEEIVAAALQEDAHAVAISSYQGGHCEFFRFVVDLLREAGAEYVRVFGGGGGVITAQEARALQDYGVTRLFSSQDGQRLGLRGMVDEMLVASDFELPGPPEDVLAALGEHNPSTRMRTLSMLITALELGRVGPTTLTQLRKHSALLRAPVIGITGTGGAGKSSVTDELVRRLRLDQDDGLRIAILSIDPSRKRSGGALLGDRIRMNAIHPWGQSPRVYMRSLATRDAGNEISGALSDILCACRCALFDVIVVETSGIGQGDTAIVPLVDLSIYVMTPEYGAASQLEKIDMLDFADFVVVNKFERRGAQDALRDVTKQVRRNRLAFGQELCDLPVYGTTAARFNDDGLTALYQALRPRLMSLGLELAAGRLPTVQVQHSSHRSPIVPPDRVQYLAEVAKTVRDYKAKARAEAALAREHQQLNAVAEMLPAQSEERALLLRMAADRAKKLDPRSRELLDGWPAMRVAYRKDEYAFESRGSSQHTSLWRTSLSGLKIPRVALPPFEDHGELLRFRWLENLPGYFPFTGGVFPFKRDHEDPTRMFAGEGDAFRTNRRFKLLSAGSAATRLSTAFDSVTLYGQDPDPRPDIYGKVGNSGVSIATLSDLKVLYEGFDLTAPSTSVSMTINGPAPTLLAMFLNVAIDQRIDAFVATHGRAPSSDECAQLRAWVFANVRGTVQADILKEDQGQNTCIFSTEFSLKLMGDIQAWFIEQHVRNFYSVSISGYHIAEAGANPITQLAFTLANGFTYVESYLARGMHIDDFAPNLSFFFSNGMDPEYSVLGRVARRIWAVAMKERYGANERSQKLKYHCQTSGRSLHAQEIAFNDIRTTLQALIATYDNANSLHTNAYDEAITTPTEESVRRAMAIQLIINREWGLAKNENVNQGSFIIEELTELVEEAVLDEFESLSERGGVLGAMELGYQRGKIQDESLLYEQRKHTGEHPVIGVNTFRSPPTAEPEADRELARSTEEEKRRQLDRLLAFKQRHAEEAPMQLMRLKEAAMAQENVFAVMMDAVRCCTLGQITAALFEVGGQYRRNT